MDWISKCLDYSVRIAPEGGMALKVLVAAVLGGVLGLEREKRGKPAGLRTNMLMAGASALLLILGRDLSEEMYGDLSKSVLSVDPTRVIHAIIMGVSFIGAGTILKSPDNEAIRNLTTASTLLFSAGAGMCVAMSLYVLAVCVTALGLAVNLLARIEA